MRKTMLAAAATLLMLPVFSQEKALKNYGFGDNWFFQGQIGGSYTFSDGHYIPDFLDRVSPHLALSVGKNFSPETAVRLQLAGWESKNYKLKTTNDEFKVNYMQVNLDGLLNFMTLFTPYEGDKTFNLYGIAGVGYQHVFGKAKDGVGTQNTIVPRLGLQFDFRLNNDLSLNLEAITSFMPDKFNGIVLGRKYDVTANLMLGLTYRFGKHFELVDVADPKLIASLNDQINQQRSQMDEKDIELDRLRAELAKKPVQSTIIKEVKEETEVLLNAVVVFKIGSAKLQDNQEINIYNAAKYLQDNPGVNITVTGYADKATGTAAINQRLSEQRAQAVFDILTKKYGIASSRITTEASGDREQPFHINEWNRVVIFRAK
ncbi:MAG TPA: hypothetical protein DIT04_01810 [Dysgonomonas sp.]|nr:hypothetical protein [Dysgonomonas sp.]